MLSKPIHHSQVQVKDEPNTIEIKVRPTRELDQLIFSFIPDVEVLSPEWYRALIADKIKENLEKYFSVQNPCTRVD